MFETIKDFYTYITLKLAVFIYGESFIETIEESTDMHKTKFE